jgi:hypothetical protein
LEFSLQAASPETFGYTLVYSLCIPQRLTVRSNGTNIWVGKERTYFSDQTSHATTLSALNAAIAIAPATLKSDWLTDGLAGWLAGWLAD